MSSDSYFYAGRGGGSAPAPPAPHPAAAAPAMPHPSGGGGGPPAGIHNIGGGGPGGGSAPAVSRPQKTQVLNHAQQAAIGGPGAPTPSTTPRIQPGGTTLPEHPGMPGGITGGHDHLPGIGEHQGQIEGRFRPEGQREFQTHPDQFRQFDPRFDHDRDFLHNRYWREEFSDYDRDRFLPLIGEDPLLYQILGINYYPELLQYAVPYYPTECGTWVIGVDSRWYRVRERQRRLIEQIELQRGIGRYQPVIIPCGVGGVGYPIY